MRNNFFLVPFVIFIFWLYSPALSQEFYVIDDTVYVISNDLVKNGLSLHSIYWAFSTLFFGNWAPVTWLSHMLDVQLFGMEACYHHLTSILIHILNFLLLFKFLKRLTKKIQLSFLVSLVFAIHPLNVETVVWIASRKELLATFFSLLTLNFYIRSEKKPINYYLAILCYFLALASKVSAISLITVLFLVEYLNYKKITSKTIIFTILSFSVFYINFAAQQYFNSVSYDSTRTFAKVIFLAIENIYQYLKIIFLPNLEYSNLYPQQNSNHEYNWFAILGAPILFISSIIYFIKTKKIIPLLGVFWFLIAVFLYLQFIPVGVQSVAHRWIYQAQIGIYLVIFSFIPDIKNIKIFSILSLIIVFLFIINRKEISYYTELRLNGERVHRLYPDNVNSDSHCFHLLKVLSIQKDLESFAFKSFLSKINNPRLLLTLLDDKNLVVPNEVRNKIEEIEKFVIVDPELSFQRALLIEKYSKRMGINKRQIIDQYIDSALRQKPDYLLAIVKKGLLFISYNDYPNAYIWLNKAYQQNPRHLDVLNGLGQYYLGTNDYNNAIKYFKKSLEINPFSNSRNYLAKIFIKQKKYSDACHVIEPTMKSQNADDEDYLVFAQCHYNLGNKGLSLKLLDFITRRNPKNKEALFNSMMINISMGNCNNAKIKSDILKKFNLENATNIDQALESCQPKLN